jgi:hypothetical protein
VDEDVPAVDDERHQRKEKRQRDHDQDQRLAAFSTLSLVKFDQVLSRPRERLPDFRAFFNPPVVLFGLTER